MLMVVHIKILDAADAQNLRDGTANMIVVEQGVWCTIVIDEVFKGAINTTLTPDWFDSSDKTLTSTTELRHGCTAMTKKSNVTGSCITKVSVSSNNLI
jgi:hypothetical protein